MFSAAMKLLVFVSALEIVDERLPPEKECEFWYVFYRERCHYCLLQISVKRYEADYWRERYEENARLCTFWDMASTVRHKDYWGGFMGWMPPQRLAEEMIAQYGMPGEW